MNFLKHVRKKLFHSPKVSEVKPLVETTCPFGSDVKRSDPRLFAKSIKT